MKEDDRKKILRLLEEDSSYASVLSNIKDDKERAKVKALTEDIYLKMAQGFMAMKKIVDDNPEAVAEVARARINKDKGEEK